jgi:hypothetical protein
MVGGIRGWSKMLPIIKAYRQFQPKKKPGRLEQGFFISLQGGQKPKSNP